MTYIAPTRQALIKALSKDGFFFVSDLPKGTRFEYRKGKHIARLP